MFVVPSRSRGIGAIVHVTYCGNHSRAYSMQLMMKDTNITKMSQSVGLSQDHYILHGEDTYPISPPLMTCSDLIHWTIT